MTTRSQAVVRNLRTITGELRQDGNGRILVAVATGWFLSIGVRFIYPSVLPFLRDEFGFGLTSAGVLVSLLWFAYAIGQFPAGVLGDRIGEGNILVISSAVSTGAILVVAMSVNVWMLFLGTFAFGFATALYGPTRFTIFTDIYETRAGTAVGLSHATGNVGNTILPAMAAAIATVATWRLGFGVLVPLFLATTLMLWLWVPDRTSSDDHPTDGGLRYLVDRVRASVTQPGIPSVVAIEVILMFVAQGFLGFYPTYLIEIKGFSPTEAAVLFGFYFAVGILVQPLAGAVTDRIGPRVTLLFLGGFYFAGLLALYFAQSLPGIILLTVLLANKNGTGVVTNTFIADAMYDDIKGTGLGLLRTGWFLIAATSPFFVGYLGDQGLLTQAFLLLAALAGTATVLAFFIPDQV